MLRYIHSPNSKEGSPHFKATSSAAFTYKTGGTSQDCGTGQDCGTSSAAFTYKTGVSRDWGGYVLGYG